MAPLWRIEMRHFFVGTNRGPNEMVQNIPDVIGYGFLLLFS